MQEDQNMPKNGRISQRVKHLTSLEAKDKSKNHKELTEVEFDKLLKELLSEHAPVLKRLAKK